MKRGSYINGFLLAPLVPALAFAIFMVILGIFMGVKDGYVAKEGVTFIFTMLFGSLGWLMFSLPVAYGVTALFGVPMFFAFKKLEITTLRAYLIGSCILGGLSSLIPIFYFTWSNSSTYFMLFFGGAFFGTMAGYTFWRIVYKLPNQTLQGTC